MAKKEKQPAAASSGETMEVTLKGPAGKVREHLGIESTVSADGDQDFQKALQDAKNVVIIKRLLPRKWEDQPCNFEVARFECPMNMTDITEEVSKEHGGRKYRIAIHDSESGTLIAAKVFEVDADPIIQPVVSESDSNYMEDVEKTPSELTEESLKNQAVMMEHQLRLATLSEQLDSMKERKKKANGQGQPDNVMDAKIATIERQIEAADRKRETDELRRKIDELTGKLQKPVQPQTQAPSELAEIVKLMSKQMDATDKRFADLLTQMREDKLDKLSQQVANLKNANSGGNLVDQVKSLAEVGKILGWSRGGDDDDDGDEPKEWYEVLIDKHLPRILDFIDERKGSGKELTKEEIMAQFNAAADKAKDDVLKQHQIRQQQQPKIEQATTTAAPTPAAPNPTGTPTTPATIPPVDQEVALRVGNVLAIIDREMEIRPREFQWPFVLWGSLPESILENALKATDPVTLFDVFTGWGKAEVLDALNKKVAENEKIKAYMARGVKELNRWKVELEKDPEFDPASEEEEGEGE